MTDDGRARAALDARRKLELRAQLIERSASGFHIQRAGQAHWHELLPGVELRLLNDDAGSGTMTALWRLAAGARIPAHPHQRDEECLVLEGDLQVDETSYGPGDFMLAPAGSRHAAITSLNGALFLIHGERISESQRAALRSNLSQGR